MYNSFRSSTCDRKHDGYIPYYVQYHMIFIVEKRRYFSKNSNSGITVSWREKRRYNGGFGQEGVKNYLIAHGGGPFSRGRIRRG